MEFKVGEFIEAVDNCGRWCFGKVSEICCDGILVKFDGYGPRHDRVVSSAKEIRQRSPPTCSPLKRKRHQHEDNKVLINYVFSRIWYVC